MRANNTGVSHPSRSHTQLSSWLRCGKAYELERLLGVPSRPGIYLPAGNACHEVIARAMRHRAGA